MERTNRNFTGLIVAVSILTLLFLATCFTGCTTASKFVRYGDKHTAVSSEYCAVRYPPKDSVSYVEKLLEGETVVVHDTTTETVTIPETHEVIKVQYRTKVVTKVDTLTRDRIVYQTNHALVTSMAANLEVAKNQANNWMGAAKKWKNRAIYAGCGLLCLLLLIAAFLYFKRRG